MTLFEVLLRYYLSLLLERKGLDVVRAQMTVERLKTIQLSSKSTSKPLENGWKTTIIQKDRKDRS